MYSVLSIWISGTHLKDFKNISRHYRLQTAQESL
jgi:hypothetical protein